MRRRGKTLHQQIMHEAAACSRMKPKMPKDPPWVAVVSCPVCEAKLAFNDRSTVRVCFCCKERVSKARVYDQIREQLALQK